jgi:cell division protein FtsB
VIETPAPARSDSFRPVLGLSLLLFVAVLGIAAWRSYHDLSAARERQKLLETRIQETHGRIDELHGRIERLRSDPGALERRAREDLGMVRPGDVVIELPVEPTPAASQGRPPLRTVAAAPPSAASSQHP